MAELVGLPHSGRRSEHLGERHTGQGRQFGITPTASDAPGYLRPPPLQSRSERSFLDSVILDSLL
jgi:hypothetical protein